MQRCNQIINHPLYQKYYTQIAECEKERIFCHHDMVHFLDVARIAWILVLEQNLQIEKEIVYAAALLHDIGRHKQYLEEIPHEIASAQLAVDILQECHFDKAEQEDIIEAIKQHRNGNVKEEPSLRGVIYRADKLSRACFGCTAEQSCNWSEDKKNKLVY